jgi:hypothetical protein
MLEKLLWLRGAGLFDNPNLATVTVAKVILEQLEEYFQPITATPVNGA